MSEIETIYRVRIFYEAPLEIREDIENKAFDFEKGITVETFSGCPAAGPYIEAESYSRQNIEHFKDKIERYIKRRKFAELFD